jgi:hypothetical protein
MKAVKYPAAEVMPVAARRSAEVVGEVGLVVERMTMGFGEVR